MWACLSFCRRFFFSSLSDCKVRSEAGRICRFSRFSSSLLWRSSCGHNRSGTVSETRVSDKQFDLVYFSSYDFQVHSSDFVFRIKKFKHLELFKIYRLTSPRREMNLTIFYIDCSRSDMRSMLDVARRTDFLGHLFSP